MKLDFRTITASILIGSGFSGLAYADMGSADAYADDGRSRINVIEFKKELLAIPKAQRDSLLHDKNRIRKYIESILSNRRAMSQADQLGIAESAEVKAETERARRDAIARIYIEKSLSDAEARMPPAESFIPLARERYESSKSEYSYPEALLVAHILFKIDVEKSSPTEQEVRQNAERVLLELKGGADFGKYAEEYSQDERSAKHGGQIPGYVTRGKMVPPFEEAAFALNEGDLSNLVRSRFGLHIIKVLKRRTAGVKPFSEVKDQIIKQLRDQQLTVIRGEILSPIYGTKEVELSDAFMKALTANQ